MKTQSHCTGQSVDPRTKATTTVCIELKEEINLLLVVIFQVLKA